MNHMMNVLNALYMEGLSTTHREELFSESRGAIHLDFSKVITMPVGFVDMYTMTELRQSYWGTAQYPVTTDLVTVNLATFTTHDGHALPVVRRISEMYADKTIYHAYYYTDTREGYIAQWRNGEIFGLTAINLSIETDRQLAAEILHKFAVKLDADADIQYRMYDMVQIKCSVNAYSDLSETGVHSRELFRTGDIGIITHINSSGKGKPVSYVVHDTVTGQDATLLPTEITSVNTGNMYDNSRTIIEQADSEDAEKEGD